MIKSLTLILFILIAAPLTSSSQSIHAILIGDTRNDLDKIPNILPGDIGVITKGYLPYPPSSGSPINTCDTGQNINQGATSNNNNDDRMTLKVYSKPIPVETIESKLVNARHLFIIFTDEKCDKFIFKGGPQSPVSPYGKVITCYGEYGVKCDDVVTNAPSVKILEGNAITSLKIDCMKDVLNQITLKKVDYNLLLGPNSNSVVYTALKECKIPTKYPHVGITPGWGVNILRS